MGDKGKKDLAKSQKQKVKHNANKVQKAKTKQEKSPT